VVHIPKITFPVMAVKMVLSEKVVANTYNPNKVARPEMDLLAQSIEADGVTQPIVTFYDAATDHYIVVDGFHRYSILVERFHCPEIPIVTIDRPLAERMASTIRHNRARGKHQVDLMGDLVSSLIGQGMTDDEIAGRLGMEGEEVLRLRQHVKAAAVLANNQYGRAWVLADHLPAEHLPEEDTTEGEIT
jgi:ParB-like chromosome segregation protein Spo0J